jgi:hypothetical protein
MAVPEPTIAGARRARRLLLPTWALTAAVVAPILVLATRLAVFDRSGISPISDLAVTALSVRDVGVHAVLTGPYSRFQWHHPGPALFYMLAVPYRLLGSATSALYAGSALWNALVAIAIVGVAWRRGGGRLARWATAVLAVYLATLSPAVLSSPWNPLILVLPFVLVVMLAWSVSVGDVVLLPVLAGIGSFTVQSHVGQLAPVAIASAFAIAGGLMRRVPAARWRLPVIATVVVLVVMWLPPVIDQFSHPGGNLLDIARWFRHTPGTNGPGTTGPIVLREIGWLPARLAGVIHGVNGHGEGGPSRTPWPIGAVTLALGIVAASHSWKRRESEAWARDLFALFALVGVLLLTSVFVLARVVGPLDDFLTLWVSALGVLIWIAVAGAWSHDSSPARVRLGVIASVFVVVVSIGNVVASVTTNAPATTMSSPEAARIANAVTAGLPQSGPGRRVYIMTSGHPTWEWMTGLTLELERRGIQVRVDGWQFMMGRRSADDPVPGARIVTLADPAHAPALAREAKEHLAISLPSVSAFVRTNA